MKRNKLDDEEEASQKAFSALPFARRTVLVGATIAVIATSFALILGHILIARSIALGSAIALLSFSIIAYVVLKSVKNKRGAKSVAVLGMVKMGLIGALLWWLLNSNFVEPIAFLAGFSTIVAALVVMAIKMK